MFFVKSHHNGSSELSRNNVPIKVCKLSTCAKKRPTFLLSAKMLQLKISCALVSTAINSSSKNSGQSNKREISAMGCSNELRPCTLIKGISRAYRSSLGTEFVFSSEDFSAIFKGFNNWQLRQSSVLLWFATLTLIKWQFRNMRFSFIAAQSFRRRYSCSGFVLAHKDS